MDFAEHVVGLVRGQLKQHPAFKGTTRDDFDLYLADLERAIREDFEDEVAGIERGAYEEGRSDVEFEIEMRAWEAKKKNKKRAAA